MVCKYCKEKVNDGAKKCPTCGEYLGVRGAWNTLFWVVGALIPIASILLAFIEFSGRVRAEEEKTVAVAEKEEAQVGLAEAEDQRDAIASTALEAIQDAAKGGAFAGSSREASGVLAEMAKLNTYTPGTSALLDRADEPLRRDAQTQDTRTRALRLLDQARNEQQSSPSASTVILSYISNSRGYLLLKAGDLDGAQSEFERATRENPDNEAARRNLALVRILKAKK